MSISSVYSDMLKMTFDLHHSKLTLFSYYFLRNSQNAKKINEKFMRMIYSKSVSINTRRLTEGGIDGSFSNKERARNNTPFYFFSYDQLGGRLSSMAPVL